MSRNQTIYKSEMQPEMPPKQKNGKLTSIKHFKHLPKVKIKTIPIIFTSFVRAEHRCFVRHYYITSSWHEESKGTDR